MYSNFNFTFDLFCVGSLTKKVLLGGQITNGKERNLVEYDRSANPKLLRKVVEAGKIVNRKVERKAEVVIVASRKVIENGNRVSPMRGGDITKLIVDELEWPVNQVVSKEGLPVSRKVAVDLELTVKISQVPELDLGGTVRETGKIASLTGQAERTDLKKVVSNWQDLRLVILGSDLRQINPPLVVMCTIKLRKGKVMKVKEILRIPKMIREAVYQQKERMLKKRVQLQVSNTMILQKEELVTKMAATLPAIPQKPSQLHRATAQLKIKLSSQICFFGLCGLATINSKYKSLRRF